MHTIVVEKQTQIILEYRFNNSSGAPTSLETLLGFFCDGYGVDSSTVEVFEIPPPENPIIIGKYIYENGQIQLNPNWVEPPRVENSSIPTTSV